MSQNAAAPAHCDSVTERLRTFMATHDLSLSELAGLMRTPPDTLEEWLEDGSTPPPWLLALMVLLATIPRDESSRRDPRTGQFRGSSFSLASSSSREQEEALRRVRAI